MSSMKFTFFLFCIVYSDTVKGQLVQLHGSTAVCENDTAEFSCSSTTLATNWDIRSPEVNPTTFSFGRFFTSPVEILGPGSSMILGRVKFVNSSVLISHIIFRKAVYFNRSIVKCNEDTISYTIEEHQPQIIYIRILPSQTRMRVCWRKTMFNYFVSYFLSNMSVYSFMPVNETSILLPYLTTRVNITSCPSGMSSANFEIGTCLFNDAINGIKRNYELNINGTWTITYDDSLNTIPALCIDGDWVYSENFSITTYGWKHEATSNVNKYTDDILVQNVIKEHSTKFTVPTLVIYIATPVVIIILISLVTTITIIAICIIKKRKLKDKTYQVTNHPNDDTYQELSNKHSNQPVYRPQHSVPPVRLNNQDNYSTLGHKLQSNNSSAQYDTIAKTVMTTSPNKSMENSEAEYSEHHNYRREKYPFGGNKYVHIEILPEDRDLNLDTLLIQLRPMSEKYKLIGSAVGVSPAMLDKIEAHPAEPFDKLVEVCDLWLKQCTIEDTTLTWRAVADILTLIGHEKLACDILQVYNTGKLPISTNMTNACPQLLHQRSITPPPPIPPHCDNQNEELDSEVALVKVKSIENGHHSTSMQNSKKSPILFLSEEKQNSEIPPPIPRKLKTAPSGDFTMPQPVSSHEVDKQVLSTVLLSPLKHENLDNSLKPPPLPAKGKWMSSEVLTPEKPPRQLPPKLPAKRQNVTNNNHTNGSYRK